MIGIAVHVVQLLVAKFIFLQDRGLHMALENRYSSKLYTEGMERQTHLCCILFCLIFGAHLLAQPFSPLCGIFSFIHLCI